MVRVRFYQEAVVNTRQIGLVVTALLALIGVGWTANRAVTMIYV